MQKDNLVFAGVIMIAIIGFAVLLLATPKGIGISPDSASYISAARNLLCGRGLTVSFDLTPDGNQLQGWIKERWGYPVLLAVSSAALGQDPLATARWVSAVLFAANIFLVGFIVMHQPCGRMWLLPITASLLMMMSTDSMLLVHSMAWSEPPCIFFGFLGMYLLANYLDKGRAWRLLCAAITIALASAIRFAATAFIAAGIFSLIITNTNRFRKRVVDVIIFLAISISPLVLWLCRNAINIIRQFSFHCIGPQHFKTICKAMGQWLPIGLASHILVGILLVVIFVIIILALIRAMRKHHANGAQLYSLFRFPILLMAFIFFHICFYLAVVFFVTGDSGIETRNYASLFVAMLILAMCMSGPLLSVFIRDEGYRIKVLTVFCAIFIIGYAVRSTIWFFNVRKDGQGFASRIFQESEVLRRVKELPADALIFSNLPEAVYIVTGRSAYMTPRKNLLGSTVLRSQMNAEFDCMQKYMRRSKGNLVFIQGLERPFLVTLDVIIDRLHLHLVKQVHDGAIYELPN